MDQVRQSVWIAESLIAQYLGVLRRYQGAWKVGDEGEMSVLRAELERVYPSIWEHLDGAAAKSRAAGRAPEAYAAIRSRPGLDVRTAITDVQERVVGVKHEVDRSIYTSQLTVQHNTDGVALARDAAAALKAAWPELDWTPPKEPDVDLRPRGFFARLFGK